MSLSMTTPDVGKKASSSEDGVMEDIVINSDGGYENHRDHACAGPSVPCAPPSSALPLPTAEGKGGIFSCVLRTYRPRRSFSKGREADDACPVQAPAEAPLELTRDWLDPSSKTHRASESHQSPEDSFDCPEGPGFQVRGTNYLKDNVKVPSAAPMFTPIGAHTFMKGKGQKPLRHAANAVPSLTAHLRARPNSSFLIVSWLIPGPPYRTVVFAFEREVPLGVDAVSDGLWHDFVNGTTEARNSRFKYLPRLDAGPRFVLSSVRLLGGEKPTLLCNKLTPFYFSGPNYFEIDIDVASSRVANMVTGLIIPKISEVAVSHAFLIEGLTEKELPERVLACIRHTKVPMLANTVVVP